MTTSRFVSPVLAILVVVAMLPSMATAQGLLVVSSATHPAPLPRPNINPRGPQPEVAYKIKEISVEARLVDQVARVNVSQTFVNTGSRVMETRFVFPLPYDGAIDRLTLMVDGKEFPAKLLAADEARRIYEGYVRQNKDPALLEWMGTGMFQTSVFPVPPGAERKVTLRYNQILKKDHSLTDFLFPLATAKYTSAPVEKIDIQVAIESAIEVKSVYSPTHSIEVKRPDAHHALVSYHRENEVPLSDFRLFVDVAKGKVGAAVISYRPDEGEDGYFLLLASPAQHDPSAERPLKNVICVFDRSGSMQGEKIKQAKAALKFVLNNLRTGDHFNIVAYDSEVEAFAPEMLKYDEAARKKALGFVEGLYAGGGTNIDGGLTKALAMFRDTKRPNYVIFMTDGQPTFGETNEGKIVAAATAANQVGARLVNFGVGYDVNSRLLDRLSRATRGQSEYVRPNEDIEVHVSRLYNKINSPVMTDIAVNFEFDEVNVEDGSPISRVYPKQYTDLFEGEQLVLTGRYKTTGTAKIRITGRVGNAKKTFDFPTTLTATSGDDSYGFVEKLWAMRRVGEIIDQLDLHGRNEELVKELVTLSTKHGILTPYTSFLADENGRVGDLAGARRGAGNAIRESTKLLSRLEEAEGKAGFAQRDLKKQFQDADKPQQEAQSGKPAEAGPGASLANLDDDEFVVTKNLRYADNLAVYRRGRQWITSDAAKLDINKLGKNARVVERFSKEYYELIRTNSKDNNVVLSRQVANEEILLEVDGKAVLVK